MKDTNSGFEVIFRIGNRTEPRSFINLENVAATLFQQQAQYPEDGRGIYAFDLYREHSGKADLSFDEFVNLDLEVDFWTQKKEFKVPISEEIARKSKLFNYRSKFICWVSPQILKHFEIVELPDVDTDEMFLRVDLDYDKVLEAWVEAGTPEEWKEKSK